MSMLPRLRPRSFYDLVIEVAIVRPGPIQGDMVHPYLRRRSGRSRSRIPSEALRQRAGEDAGRPAVPGAGDEDRDGRRGLHAERGRPAPPGDGGVAADGRDRTVPSQRSSTACCGNGYTPEFAEQCFNQIKGFGEYGFPESHAASFALLVYVSAWLKCHHPAAFAAALLNSQPMGFYAPRRSCATRRSTASRCGRWM